MNDEAVAALQKQQAGVLARRQVLALDGCDKDIRRKLRRRDWARVHPGVYVDHTGPLTWEQRAWAAVLALWPAALAGHSALRASKARAGLSGSDDDPIEVVVTEGRRVKAPEGVTAARVRDYETVVQHNLSPPRVRLEHAVLTRASAASTADGAVGLLADACQSRRTTARRLADQLDCMPRLPSRALLSEVLADVAVGAFSALERRYLVEVERRHGLPPATRQLREASRQGVVFRDVLYPDQAFLVELDGRLGHEWNADRWSDLDRDVASAEEQRLTVRAGWKQVLDPCRLARSVARILRARGWNGNPVPCGTGCALDDIGGSQSPGDQDPPALPAA